MEAKFYEKEGKLFFRLEKPAITQPAEPYVFDGPATPRHLKDYARQFKEFEKSKASPVVEAAAPAKKRILFARVEK